MIPSLAGLPMRQMLPQGASRTRASSRLAPADAHSHTGFLPCPCWLAAQKRGDLRVAAEFYNVGNGAVGVDGVVADGGRGRNPVGSEGLCEGKSLQMLDVCEHCVERFRLRK